MECLAPEEKVQPKGQNIEPVATSIPQKENVYPFKPNLLNLPFFNCQNNFPLP